jgi:hypothetical protein
MDREKMIDRIMERVREADEATLEDFFWFLELDLDD